MKNLFIKILLLLFLLFQLTSCFEKKENNNINDNIVEDNVIIDDVEKDEKILEKTNSGINFSSGTKKIEKIKPIIFKDKAIKKIDGFFVEMKNANFLTGTQLNGEKSEEIEKRQFDNLKIEVFGQLPMILKSANELLEKIGTGSNKSTFLSTLDGIQFERIILMLETFDFKKDFSHASHYKIKEQEAIFENLKKSYNELKSK